MNLTLPNRLVTPFRQRHPALSASHTEQTKNIVLGITPTCHDVLCIRATPVYTSFSSGLSSLLYFFPLSSTSVITGCLRKAAEGLV